jgi:quercetin dioxygenase-like cupin family protein
MSDPTDPAYPPATYLGEGGEVSAFRVPADTPADLTYVNGTRVRLLVTGAQTGGLFGLYRWELPPGPGGAAPHFHRTITETFHVLDGLVEIYDGRTWALCGPGDTAHVPIGGIHGFRNGADGPSAMLLHFAPGAPREDYFRRLPELLTMDDEERAAFFAAHDNHYI